MMESYANIPLRLDENERHLLSYLMSALNVCEYVNNVDVPDGPRETRTVTELKDVYQIMLSMLVSSSEVRDRVKSWMKEDPGSSNANCMGLIAQMFEVGRRYKRMNPARMRSEYGKLMWILMDANLKPSSSSSGRVVIPVRTVGALLEEIGQPDLLRHPQLKIATNPEVPAEERQQSLSDLLKNFPKEIQPQVEIAVRSIDDANQCVYQASASLAKLIQWLEMFKSGAGTADRDLAISHGRKGSCLTHSHSTQYTYVKSTLTLWSIIQREMMNLWCCVEDDLLDAKSRYYFQNTGQGFHRVKSCPNTSREAHACLAEASRVMGGWVGLGVIHLGDRDVPNALVFIDKYTQVPRIVNPIIEVIENLERSPSKYPGVQEYIISVYGSIDAARTAILQDFFKHGFDGSGDDGGSCIDGRLTSAWNWCSLLSKKPYYNIFLLCGFVSFDGQF
eukprot:PhF_6_TR22278/c0_g1_i1/m.31512